MKPLLSVIIPAYKFERYLLQCVNSVLSQRTNFFFEVLIRDDHSGDGTNNLLRDNFSDHPSVKILESDKNVGAYENIRILLNESRGKYIAYLDGDDYYDDPDKLQKQIDFLENNPNYVMHSTGYRYVNEENELIPPCDTGGRWLFPTVPNVNTEDILERNIVGFGRVFRNFPDLLKPEYSDITYVDWVTNIELSFLGQIRCEEWPSGCYRISDSGAFSKVSEEDKERERLRVSEIIKKRYKEKMENPRRVISIVDCFVHDQKVEANLINCIDRLKKNGHDVFLVSNTSIDKSILKMVDYHFYDSRNQLFKKEYPGVNDVDFWSNQGGFTVHNVKSGLQKHGLSVLINLFNVLSTCKNIGYTHFQRFETDDLYGENSMEWIRRIPSEVLDSGKKGLFYLNEYNIPADASFHYFFCEIDHFLNIMPRISCEEDYEKYLIDIQGTRDFRIVETYIYDNVKKSHLDSLVIKDGGDQMKSDFPDTTWNTVVSASNLSGKYDGCVTDLYQLRDKEGKPNGYCLYSQNYMDKNINRKIVIHNYDSTQYEIYHELNGRNSWWLNDLVGVPSKIDVYESDELLYSHTREENSGSYIQLNP
jgi:glycosyltransferase involved in cell wall biosynthesis